VTSGWEEATAIGTIALAAVTALLAATTRRLAREAGAETRANWQPVVMPHVDEDVHGIAIEGLSLDERELMLRVHNIGRGPALSVSMFLWDESVGEEGGTYRGFASSNAVAPNFSLKFRWRDFDPPLPSKLAGVGAWSLLAGKITYFDVSSTRYETYVRIGFRSDRRVGLISERFGGAPGDRLNLIDRAMQRIGLWAVQHDHGPDGDLRSRLAHRLARMIFKPDG
jgi:hypothetical protein